MATGREQYNSTVITCDRTSRRWMCSITACSRSALQCYRIDPGKVRKFAERALTASLTASMHFPALCAYVQVYSASGLECAATAIDDAQTK
jgi:hypothetical protein